MFRPVARAVARSASSSTATLAARRIPTRRWASTVGAEKPRGWKSSAVRWGLAGAIVYYYNTSNVFAEEATDQYAHHLPPASSDTEALPTLDSYSKNTKTTTANAQATGTLAPELAPLPEASSVPTGGAEDLEAEASQQGAFNEETGEINWECPCLGGMAHGPCGEEFRAAFSCFVYSTEEPKGVDCIDKFKGMQDCFRAHPDVYGAELEDDEEGDGDGVAAGAGELAVARDATGSLDAAPESGDDDQKEKEGSTERAKAVAAEVKTKHIETSESETVVPKAWHDASSTEAAREEEEKSKP